MVKLAVNSVLLRGVDFQTAVHTIAAAGYDGIEIAAIKGMCEHLDLSRWQEQVAAYRTLVAEAGLAWVAMEVGSPDPGRVQQALDAAQALGIPTVTIGPGGKSDDAEEWRHMLDRLQRLGEMADAAGVNLAVKAHIGQSMYNTPTTIEVLSQVTSPHFGVDLDPSHLFRSGEDPANAARAVMGRIHHVHIRDCKRGAKGPGPVTEQICGRGDIDLEKFCAALVAGGYQAALTLEVIGVRDEEPALLGMLAAENRGYLRALLRRIGGAES